MTRKKRAKNGGKIIFQILVIQLSYFIWKNKNIEMMSFSPSPCQAGARRGAPGTLRGDPISKNFRPENACWTKNKHHSECLYFHTVWRAGPGMEGFHYDVAVKRKVYQIKLILGSSKVQKEHSKRNMTLSTQLALSGVHSALLATETAAKEQW